LGPSEGVLFKVTAFYNFHLTYMADRVYLVQGYFRSKLILRIIYGNLNTPHYGKKIKTHSTWQQVPHQFIGVSEPLLNYMVRISIQE
jgi:hypothetical protein